MDPASVFVSDHKIRLSPCGPSGSCFTLEIRQSWDVLGAPGPAEVKCS